MILLIAPNPAANEPSIASHTLCFAPTLKSKPITTKIAITNIFENLRADDSAVTFLCIYDLSDCNASILA